MKAFTAKQLHDNPSEVYRAAVKEPVKITHKHHGNFIISATEQPQAYVYMQVADESICYSGSDALAKIADFRPEEYMKNVTSEMIINYA